MTTPSRSCKLSVKWPAGVFLRWQAALAIWVIGLAQVGLPAADRPEAVADRFAAQAASAFRVAKADYLANTNQSEAAWKFGRAAYDLAEFATNQTQRADLAEQGIAASRAVVAQAPDLAAGHYYLGMNLGQLARTRTLGALKLVNQMEGLFKRARELDPHFNFAGPDRQLGRLYHEAPGWPTSIGNDTLARQHLSRAAALEPEYPGNRLVLAEFHLQRSDLASAREELEAVSTVWSKAQAQLKDKEWESSWAEWEQRRARLQRKLDGTAPKDQVLKRSRGPSSR